MSKLGVKNKARQCREHSGYAHEYALHLMSESSPIIAAYILNMIASITALPE